jgi:hypothetical protein
MGFSKELIQFMYLTNRCVKGLWAKKGRNFRTHFSYKQNTRFLAVDKLIPFEWTALSKGNCQVIWKGHLSLLKGP